MADEDSAAERIDTTPATPQPPTQFVEAAERAIPNILANVAPRNDGVTELVASHLAKQLQDAGHTLAAAQWAVHQSVRAGRLRPGVIEVESPSVGLPLPGGGMAWSGGGRGIIAIPRGKPAPFDSFMVMATEALWAWWRSSVDETPKQAKPVIKAGEPLSQQSDLRRLVVSLEKEINDRETSIPGELVPPERLRGTDLYSAVQAVERHYGGKLPIEPWKAWRGMLLRAGDGKGDDDQYERYGQYYECCETLCQWAKAELSRMTRTTDHDDENANQYAGLDQLKPAHRKAYLSFLYAEAKKEKRLEDRDAWEWLKEYGIEDASETDLQDYELPVFATWCRYLRVARQALNERKYTPRSGRKRSD